MSGFDRIWVKRSAVLAILVMLVLAAGCSGKVTAENYAKLKVGMGYDDVVALLGEPDRSEEKMTFRTCTWGGVKKSITVRFLAGRVVFFSNEGLP